jgi:hypothetical protein
MFRNDFNYIPWGENPCTDRSENNERLNDIKLFISHIGNVFYFISLFSYFSSFNDQSQEIYHITNGDFPYPNMDYKNTLDFMESTEDGAPQTCLKETFDLHQDQIDRYKNDNFFALNLIYKSFEGSYFEALPGDLMNEIIKYVDFSDTITD